MKKILLSLIMVTFVAVSTSSLNAQDVKKSCHEEKARKESCESRRTKSYYAENKTDAAGRKTASKNACFVKKEANAETKSCGKK
jgi:Ni/Co efflux regulator RcnB